MANNTLKIFYVWLAFVLVTNAHAGSVSLVYAGDNPISAAGAVLATAGDELAFDIYVDFSDTPTIGGGYDLMFDPTVLAFDYINISPNYCKWVCSGYSDPTSGLLESLSFGSFNGISGPITVATLIFQYTGPNDHSSVMALGPTNGIAGPFISAIDFVSSLDVEYNSLEIRGVPLPAALWLLLGGLAALVGFRLPAA